jgi:hypothetical protein
VVSRELSARLQEAGINMDELLKCIERPCSSRQNPPR